MFRKFIFSLFAILFVSTMVWQLSPVEASGTCAQYHTVVPGETLFRIAQRYGTTTVNIQTLNLIANPNIIFAGQRLCVQSGDVVVTPAPIPQSEPFATVTAYYLNMRGGPGIEHPILHIARRGQTFRIVGRSADNRWYQVLANLSGTQWPSDWVWLSAGYVQLSAPAAVPVVNGGPLPGYTSLEVLNSDALIYNGPGTNFGSGAGVVFAGMSVNVIGRNADANWLQIRTDQGAGWVSLNNFPNSMNPFHFPVTA